MKKVLTKKEKMVLEILRREEIELPSLRMVRKILAGQYGWILKSNNSLTQFYRQLAEKGYIEIIPREIKVIYQPHN